MRGEMTRFFIVLCVLIVMVQENTGAIQVRLMDGKTPHDGRVEVRQDNGQWNTICNYKWDIRDAHVVCRMLNYTRAVSAHKTNAIPHVYIDVPFCPSYSYLWNCLYLPNSFRCREATVVCSNDSMTPEEKAIKVRLVGTNVRHIGRVDIMYNGTWGGIGDTDWDIKDAHVICRMMGFKGAAETHNLKKEKTSRILLNGLGCSGKEKSVAECIHNGWGAFIPINEVKLAGVICEVDADPPPVTVRLTGGPTPNSGRVEIYYAGAWGTISEYHLSWSERWGGNEAEVVCRMLGYPGVQDYKPAFNFATTNGIIWYSDLSCIGTEMSITNCIYSDIDWVATSQYSHSHDVGVTCKMAPQYCNSKAPQFNVINFAKSLSCSLKVNIIDHYARNMKENNTIKAYEVTVNKIGKSSTSALQFDGVDSFTIGDGKRYNGKYNAPLQPGTSYNITVRAVTKAQNGQGDCYGKAASKSITTRTNCTSKKEPPPVRVHLAEGPTSNSGRVEVLIHGAWGYVCSDGWEKTNDAEVVCRMLGYPGVQKYTSRFEMKKFPHHCHWSFGCTGRNEICNGLCLPAGITCKRTEAPQFTASNSSKSSLCTLELNFTDYIARSIKKNISVRGYSIDIYKKGDSWTKELLFDGTESVTIGDGKQYFAAVPFPSQRREPITTSPDNFLSTDGIQEIQYNTPLYPGTTYRITVRPVIEAPIESFRRFNYGEAASKTFTTRTDCTDGKDIQVRLMDGKTPHDGRVEVRHGNGKWNTICDKNWGLKDAKIACRMLNYTMAVSAGTTNVRSSVYPKLLNCNGHETSIEQCTTDSFSCREATVVCRNSLTPEEKKIKVRLVGTNVPYVGRVEILYNGVRGAVCTSWLDPDPKSKLDVICQMLGYKAALEKLNMKKKTTKVLMNNVGCTGKEKSIAECIHKGWGAFCYSGQILGVVCQTDADPPPVQVRLAGGPSSNSGRVEVRYHGVWGTVSNYEWNKNGAKVVCGMLGYPWVLDYKTSNFKNTIRIMWLKNVQCNGTEISITNCSYDVWKLDRWGSDVGVSCKRAAAPQFTVRKSSKSRSCTLKVNITDHNVRNVKEKNMIKGYEVGVRKVRRSIARSRWIQFDRVDTFTIGDGKRYNGKYNTPLPPATRLIIAVRAVTKAQNGGHGNGEISSKMITTRFYCDS